ncbi:MAG: hypothetical protein DRI61_11525, partial [Chloroflexi bacterium]
MIIKQGSKFYSIKGIERTVVIAKNYYLYFYYKLITPIILPEKIDNYFIILGTQTSRQRKFDIRSGKEIAFPAILKGTLYWDKEEEKFETVRGTTYEFLTENNINETYRKISEEQMKEISPFWKCVWEHDQSTLFNPVFVP